MVTFRPRRVRVVCIVAAVAVFILFTAIGTLLTEVGESGAFRPGDQYAMIGLGVMFAAGIMLIARPQVTADEAGVRVRNIAGGYELPWEAVRAIRFERGQPWLSLELVNDDTVSVLAVQAADKAYAVDAVQALRSLHQRAGDRREAA